VTVYQQTILNVEKDWFAGRFHAKVLRTTQNTLKNKLNTSKTEVNATE